VDAFAKASSVSERSLAELKSYLEFRGWTLQPYVDRWSQIHRGDYRAVNSSTGVVMNLEVKAEAKSTGNLFIETWSNKTEGRRGWLYNLDECSCLIYHFLDSKAYVIQFERLRNFDLSRYEEKPQHRYEQRNDTWGVLVPIADLKRAGVITQEIGLPVD